MGIELYHYTFQNRLVLLVLASVIALALGGPRWLHHLMLYDVPSRLWRRFAQGAEAKLNRDNRSVSVRRFRGKLYGIMMLSVAVLVGCGVVALHLNTPWGWYVELAILAYLLPIRAALLPVLEAKAAIKARDQEAFMAATALLPTLDDPPRDAPTAIRACIGYIAESLPRYVMIPAFYYVLLGLPGLLICRMLSMMLDLCPIQRHRAFMGFTYAAYRFIYAIPMHLACCLMWLAMVFVPRSGFRSALTAFQRGLAGALPVRLAAYGFGYALGGPALRDALGHYGAWVNESGRAKLALNALNRALIWYAYSAALWLIGIAVLRLMWGG